MEAPQPQNPDWLRDEIILALNVYMRHRGQPPGKHSTEIASLSELLRQMHATLGTRGKATLRNTNGVYMKLMNLRRLDPLVVESGRSGLSGGGRLEAEVWENFGGDPARLRRVAEAITAQIRGAAPSNDKAQPTTTDAPDIDDDDEEAPEGRILTRLHRSRERNRRLVSRKKTDAMKRHGRLACEACAFDFKASYGERGADFIECHHTRPLETLGDSGTTKTSDLVLLCANCHRMIHAKRPWLSVAELLALIF